ncbi:MAG: EAL domain-containing protein [Methylococcaceae bacterium]|nr:EAL domain-containing protein [Methylococcaceae bacterium]
MKTIASKFNSLTIFLIVLSAGVTGGYIIWQQQLNAFNSFNKQGEAIAVMLSKNIEFGVYTENQKAIEQSLQSLEGNPDIAYIQVYNKTQQLLSARNFLKLSELPNALNGQSGAGQTEINSSFFSDAKSHKAYFNIVAPILIRAEASDLDLTADFDSTSVKTNAPQFIGDIQIGISQDRIYKESQQFMLQTLLVAALVSFVGIVLTVVQTRRIIRPIKKLLSATRAIARGEFGEVLIPASEDEVGQLTVAFNDMSSSLGYYQSEALKQRETLEEQVEQRTLDLQQKTDEAYELARKAQVASKVKSEFLATMSHEIRTPMNGVLGMTELLLNTEMTGRQKRLAETAYRSAESLLGVINNILDFSKIEAGKLQLINADFDLRGLLEDTVEMLSTQAHSKGLELILNCPVDLEGTVRGDAERLRQVFLNLLGNALKFTAQGEIQLKVTWVENSLVDADVHLRFEVIDTGMGIALEQQASIFESFTQADGSITRRFGGTGLGLTISRQLVALMGGNLELSSISGEGSNFYFSLSMARGATLAYSKAVIKDLKNLKVLVVDDNATNRAIFYDQLKFWGINCYCVPNGQEALRQLLLAVGENKPYDLALLDWHMPEMDGLTLAKILNAESRIQPLSLMMLSSDTISFEADKEQHYGIRCFLTKPVKQQQLLTSLLEVVGANSEQVESPSQPLIKSAPNSASTLSAKILLAEDNLINQEVGQGILQAIGCNPLVVNNGLEAVDAFINEAFDLILMDCHMPEMDGFQAAATIREREQALGKTHRLPIIALTADVQKGIVEQCLNAGMDDYLSKPFSKLQLQAILEKWLPLNEESSASAVALAASVVMNVQHAPRQQYEMQGVSGGNVSDTGGIQGRDKIAQRREEQVGNLLDEAALDNLRQITSKNGENLLGKAIKLYLNSAPEAMQSLQIALDNKDSDALGKAAHSFKSACANLGATALAKYAASLEAIGKQGTIAGAEQIFKAMGHELPKVLNALTKELQWLSAPITVDAPIAEHFEEAVISVLPQLQYKRILVVDDDPSFRLITSAVLSTSNFIVDEACNGTQALEKIIENLPDLVILDAIMDGMDGFETCRLMRMDARMVDVPIIMSTGLGDIESINRAYDAGATEFVIKPLSYPILIHRIWFMLKASQLFAELKNSQLRLSAAQRIARLGYWTFDAEINSFYLSEHLAQLCNINLTAFSGTLDAFIEQVYHEDRGFVRDVILNGAQSKILQHIEYRLYVHDISGITVGGMPLARTTDDDQVIELPFIVVQQEIETLLDNNNHTIITGTVQDITHKKEIETQVHRLAYFDNLTGLASRTYYHERIQDFIKSAIRHNKQFAFLFLDLDGFKQINDSFGHDKGDQFLKAIAERLKLIVRDVDFAVRLGGDEFCIILDDITNEEQVSEVAMRCLHAINQPLLLGQHQLKPRVSIGVAIFPRDGMTETYLMKAADAAMYAAKKAGKQRFCFYSKDMASEAIIRLEREQMLHDAFELKQFFLEYQPQVSMQTGYMIGMEALIRWQHPEQGVISPVDFIPLAEELGLMVELGNWVVRTVCEQQATWYRAGLPLMLVAVNISPAHFKDPRLLKVVQEALTVNSIPAQYLELEVTESAMQTEGYLQVFKQLRDYGVKIAIDDFGTGYSCLASLQQLPLDTLKVDKIFVDDVLENPNTALLLGTIIGLAKALNYTVVAEGVETKEQALVMHGLGCNILQGYLFSRPVSGERIAELAEVDFTQQQTENLIE